MSSAATLARRCFALGPDVRYVAVYRDDVLHIAERPGIANASAAESDRYEELIVNPAIVTLARQRGNIDCGGLEYVVIRYGSFIQTVHPVPGGHVSVAFEPESDAAALTLRAREVIAEWLADRG